MITEETTQQKLARLGSNTQEWVAQGREASITIEELKALTFPDADILVTWWEVMCKETQAHFKPLKMDRQYFMVCLDHSALVPWLLAGNDPLPEPPPTSHSRPWHDIIVKGWGSPMEVWVPGKKHLLDPEKPELVVDQCRWTLLEIISEDVFIGRWYKDDRWIFVGVKDKKAFTGKRWVVKRL